MVSFPPLSDMLKFGGFATLTRGRHLGTYGRQNLNRFDVRDGSDLRKLTFLRLIYLSQSSELVLE